MMPLRANSSLLVGLFALALIPGCEKKPVTPATPAQAPAPAASPAPADQAPTDQGTQQAQTSHPPSQGTPPPDPGQVQAAEGKPEPQSEAQAPDETADKNKEKPDRPSTQKKRSPQTARNTPPKVVVKPDAAAPSPTPGQISPGPASSDVSHDQANTEQLLQSSESNLNSIKRQLSQDEQAIVAQIHDYMTQSRQAMKDNDLARARTFALKAHLLSDDLAKRR